MVTWYDKDGSKSYSTKERLTIWAVELIVIVVAAIISVDLLKSQCRMRGAGSARGRMRWPLQLLPLVGYFLMYGPLILAFPIAIVVIHYVDTHWEPERFIRFKGTMMALLVVVGIPIYVILFVVGTLLTR